ncbi:NTPase [Acidianus brierleyi]|uniref:Nucleoside-triphosphatase DFR85_14600 n=1 Tax=Acidianus brierleyi TaxID=41673 RepID=A0A2U9IJF8_9CREN|nr:NTPase [Acidianus brierleyi]AWR96064.1 NTPase [Acidianus brierleyi]
MKIFITGNPGVGKTTTLMYIINEVKKRGISVSGFYCPEVRENGKRIGFKIIDISTGKEKWLAKVGEGRIRVGKYAVQQVDDIANEIYSSLSNSKIIAIDEIGPMELSIPSIKRIIDYALKTDKPLIAVVHRNIKEEGKIYTLTLSNRNVLKEEILNEILNNIS